MTQPLPVALGAVIKEGEILLVKRDANNFQGLYGFHGGKVEGEEHILEALKREILEETGYNTSFREYLGTVSEKIENPEDYSPTLLHFYLVEPKEKVSEGEMDMKWFNLENISDYEENLIPSGFQMMQQIILGDEKGYFESQVKRKDEVYNLKKFKKIGGL